MKTIKIEEKLFTFNEEELESIYVALIIRCKQFKEEFGFYPPKDKSLLDEVEKELGY